jgi:hypothetical protein
MDMNQRNILSRQKMVTFSVFTDYHTVAERRLTMLMLGRMALARKLYISITACS